jgi:hypothetical protein
VKLGFNSQQGQEILLFDVQDVLKSTQSHIHWMLMTFPRGLKQLRRKAANHRSCSTEGKDMWSSIFTSPCLDIQKNGSLCTEDRFLTHVSF